MVFVVWFFKHQGFDINEAMISSLRFNGRSQFLNYPYHIIWILSIVLNQQWNMWARASASFCCSYIC